MSNRRQREKLRQQRIAFDREIEEVRRMKELEIPAEKPEKKPAKEEPKEEKKPAKKRGRPSKKRESK